MYTSPPILFSDICFTFLSEPTQIYRYLRTRNMISPIFLHRTLSFMRKRTSRSRSDKYRQDFKVDSLLKRKESEIRETDTLKLDKFMNLTFLGYYDRKCKICIYAFKYFYSCLFEMNLSWVSWISQFWHLFQERTWVLYLFWKITNNIFDKVDIWDMGEKIGAC